VGGEVRLPWPASRDDGQSCAPPASNEPRTIDLAPGQTFTHRLAPVTHCAPMGADDGHVGVSTIQGSLATQPRRKGDGHEWRH
jgi:hypothetical protein